MSAPVAPAPRLSLIVMTIGPERVVARAIETALAQDAPGTELVIVHDGRDEGAPSRLRRSLGDTAVTWVPAPSAGQGAARNAGVRSSRGACFLVIDGGVVLPPDHARRALTALGDTADAAFAAASGGAFFGEVKTGSVAAGEPITGGELVESAWAVAAAVVRRTAFDAVNGFDESLAAHCDWELLLRLVDAGLAGIAIEATAERFSDDDVRAREALGAPRHLPDVRRVFEAHRATFEAHMRRALVGRERTIDALYKYERALLERRTRMLATLNAALDELAAQRRERRARGLPAFDFAALRRTSPVSRQWGSDRGVPIDRHYIHQFMAGNAQDVRGHVLELLDDGLTTAYGGDRVHRRDVLDIDPGNTRATLVADLRTADSLPANVYDCFILTQTLHLIDDMPAALRTAWRVLKPGGVLLATLPCASMVAAEYGAAGDHWRVTEAGARSLFEQVFPPSSLSVRAHGNVLTTTAFLYGLCCDDLEAGEFAVDDPAYPLIVTVRAEKPVEASAGRRPARGAPAAAILLYHRVADAALDTHGLCVSPAAFRSQLDHLRQSWHVVPLADLAAAAAAGDLPERAVALTFDDGYLDNLEVAAPMLAEHGLPATFFLTSEPLPARRSFWWDALERMLLACEPRVPQVELRVPGRTHSFAIGTEAERRQAHEALHVLFKSSAPVVRDEMLRELARQLAAPPLVDGPSPMIAPEVLRLRDLPQVEIGAHGAHHLSLPHVAAETCHGEVFESRSALERLVGRPVTSFAYPFGDVSPGAVSAVMAAGFRIGVACEDRAVRPRAHPLRLPRLPTRNESGAELEARLARAIREVEA
jgi:peptidoglycan/xylan/chitin deacetylase (PgdA/CDA1 family)/glycosyltransferase involved in cell wall biosynthesis